MPVHVVTYSCLNVRSDNKESCFAWEYQGLCTQLCCLCKWAPPLQERPLPLLSALYYKPTCEGPTPGQSVGPAVDNEWCMVNHRICPAGLQQHAKSRPTGPTRACHSMNQSTPNYCDEVERELCCSDASSLAHDEFVALDKCNLC